MTLEWKIFMLTGWGQMACRLPGLQEAMDDALKARPGGRWGIAVADDPWALEYQRLKFQVERICYAFGKSPMVSHKRWGPQGFEEVGVAEANRQSIAKSRAKAHKAVHDPGWQKLMASLEEAEAQAIQDEMWREYNAGRL